MRKLILGLALLVSLLTATYHVLGRDRAPPPLVRAVDATGAGYSRIEGAVLSWIQEKNEDLVQKLVSKENEKAKQKLSEERPN